VLGAYLVLLILFSTSSALAQVPSDGMNRDTRRRKNALLKKGQLLQYRGQHKDAIEMYRRAAALKPDDLGTVLLLSGLLYNQGRVVQASRAWEHWMKQSTRSDRLEVVSSNLLARLLMAGDLARAETVCEEWLRRLAIRNRFAVLGGVFWKRGHRSRAIQLYTSHLALVPGDRVVLERVVTWYLRAGPARAAAAAYRVYLGRTPEDLEVTRRLVALLVKHGRKGVTQAWSRWLAASRMARRHAVVGDYHRAAGDEALAAHHYAHHLQQHPADMDALHYLAVSLQEQGRQDHAVRLYNRAAASTSDSRKVREVASTLMGLGRVGDAERAWSRWLARSTAAGRLKVVARFLVGAGKPERAAPLYQKHLVGAPADEEAVIFVAGRYLAKGERERARAVLTRFIKRSRSEKRHEVVAHVYLGAGKVHVATQIFKGHMRRVPDDKDGLERFAGLLVDRRRWSEAGGLWGEYCRSSRDEDRFEHAGDFYEDRDRPKEAMAYYGKHLALQPGDEWVVKALAKLYLEASMMAASDRTWQRYLAHARDRDRFQSAGQFYLEAKRNGRAVTLFRRHLKLHPRSIEAHGDLAKALHRAGRTNEAAATWDRATGAVGDLDRFEKAGDFFRDARLWSRAESAYRKHLASYANGLSGYKSLAGVLLQQGKSGQAAALWERAVKICTDRDRFEAAADFYKKLGKLLRAIAMLRKHLALHPKSLSAVGSLADALRRAGKIDQAAALWDRTIRASTDADRFESAGAFFKEIGRWDRAAVLYRRHLALKHRDLGANDELARVLVRAGRTSQAVRVWERAVRVVDDKERYRRAGAFYKGVGRWDRALAAYRRHLALNPTSLDAHGELATALRGTGKIEQAVALWEKAARTLRDEYRFSRAGNFFRETGRLARAAAMFRRHVALKPDSYSEYRSLTSVLLSMGKAGEAEAVVRKQPQPGTDKNRYSSMGSYYSSTGRPRRALAMFRKHLAQNPNDRWAHDSLAGHLLSMGRTAEAVAVWDSGLKACKEPYRLVRAARLHQLLGNLGRATALKRRYLRARSQEVGAYQYLADALLAAGRTAEAEKVWRRGVRSGPAHRFRAAADFYRRAGKMDRALPLYRKYLALEPASCHAHRDLARALLAVGKGREADRVWERGLKRCKETYGKEFAANHYRDRGQLRKAITLYRAYLGSSPLDRTAIRSLAGALTLAGRPREAEATLLRAAAGMGLELRYLAVGKLYAQTGRLDEAIARFQEHVAVAPGESAGYRHLAGAYLAAGKKKLAEAVWSKGLQRCTDRYCAAHAADYYLFTGRCDLALPLYAKLVAADRRNLYLYDRLVRCLTKRGKTAEARRQLEIALAIARNLERLAPSDYFTFKGEVHFQASMYNSSAWFYLVHRGARKQWKHALVLARKAARLVPSNPSFLGTLIVALYRNGRASEALPVLRRRLALDPHSAWGQMEAALVYLKLGKKDLARKHLARSRKLRLVPDTQIGQFEREVLAGLGHRRTK